MSPIREVKDLNERIGELLAHHKLGWVIRARVNKQLKIPGKGKYDDSVELTLEAVGPGYETQEAALEGLKKLKEELGEQLLDGLKKLSE